MKRLYYESPEDAHFRRRLDQGINYTVHRPSDNQSTGQNDMSSGSVIQASQATETPTKPDSHPPARRRIQVACFRCRKRKIRCSGDTGNGQGCTNCKSSGTSNCVFLRVNSSPIQAGSGFPYAVLKSLNSPTAEARRGYEPQAYVGANSISMHSIPQLSSSTSTSSPVSPSDFDYGTTPPSSAFHRTSYASGNSLGYDDSSGAYRMQTPSYMLPSVDTGSMSSVCGVPNNLRGWSSSSQPLKQSNANTTLYCDTDTSASLVPSDYTFASNTSSQATTLAECASMFSVGASVPSGTTGTDRTLPNPTGNRNGSHMTSGPGVETLANISVSASQSQSYRKQYPVGSDGLLPVNDREAENPTHKHASGESSPEAMKATSSSPQDMGFGYIPISSSSPVPTMEMTDGFPSCDLEARSKREDLLYPPDICTSMTYGYSTAPKRGTPYNSSSAATLTSGHEYTQLIHPQDQTMMVRPNAENLSTMSANGHAISSHSNRHAF